MITDKEFSRIVKGITSSSHKKQVLRERIEAIIEKERKEEREQVLLEVQVKGRADREGTTTAPVADYSRPEGGA